VRRDLDPGTISGRDFYAVLNAVVVPRPIAWVSSLSADGVLNLAPHSFFTVACVRPPMVQFTSVGRKDSLNNVEATGEFVVNFAAEALFEQVNATATNFPPDISEFAAVGLTTEPAATVSVPRVAESPVASECGLHTTLELGDSTVVIGRVRHIAIDESVLDGDQPASVGGVKWPGQSAWRIRVMDRISPIVDHSSLPRRASGRSLVTSG
jgi:flavin reductase (DIM6/NTAB) family NADH-FMN oxidoreductase RutF